MTTQQIPTEAGAWRYHRANGDIFDFNRPPSLDVLEPDGIGQPNPSIRASRDTETGVKIDEVRIDGAPISLTLVLQGRTYSDNLRTVDEISRAIRQIGPTGPLPGRLEHIHADGLSRSIPCIPEGGIELNGNDWYRGPQTWILRLPFLRTSPYWQSVGRYANEFTIDLSVTPDSPSFVPPPGGGLLPDNEEYLVYPPLYWGSPTPTQSGSIVSPGSVETATTIIEIKGKGGLHGFTNPKITHLATGRFVAIEGSYAADHTVRITNRSSVDAVATLLPANTNLAPRMDTRSRAILIWPGINTLNLQLGSGEADFDVTYIPEFDVA